jgi:hypothetical protein
MLLGRRGATRVSREREAPVVFPIPQVVGEWGGGAVAEPMSQFSGRTKTPTTDSTRIGKPLNVFLVNQDRPATVPLDALVAPEEALEVPPASIPPRDTDRGYGNNRLRHAGPRASNRTKSRPPVTDESSKPRSHSS